MSDDPQQRPEDILTPQDTLDPAGVTVASPPIDATATIDATNTGAPQQQVAVQAAPADANSNGYDVEERPPSYSGLKDKSFRKILLLAGSLAAIFVLLVSGTLLVQHSKHSSTPKTQASLDQQSVKLQSASQLSAATAPVQAGVPTLQVNGDLATQGSLRLGSGSNYAQFSATGLNGKNVYTLPNASGTICLSSGNCSGTAGTTTTINTTNSSSVTNITNITNGSSAPLGVQSLNGSNGDITIQSSNSTIQFGGGGTSIDLTLPQDISAGAAPTFAGLNLTGQGYQNGQMLCDYGNQCGFNGSANILNIGGNSVGADIRVGTIDNYGFTIMTNGVDHLSISNTGTISLGNSNVDRLAFNGQITGQDPFVFQGATNDFLTTTLEVVDPTNQNLIKLPNASGTICLDTGNCNGSGNIGDILSTGNYGKTIFIGSNDVHSLTLGTQAQPRIVISAAGDTTVNGNLTIGSSSAARLAINSQLLGSNFVFQGATDDAYATTFQITDPTHNNTIVFPDAGGTVCFVGAGCGSSGGTGDINNGGNNIGNISIGTNGANDFNLRTNGVPRLTITSVGVATFAGDLNVNGNTTIGSSSSNRLTVTSQISGQDALVFQGATDDANTTTLRVTNPTANRIITLPDASGVVCLVGGSCGTAGSGGDVYNGGQPTGALAVGTIGAQNLTLLTGGATRVTISGTTGQATFSGDLQVNGNTTLGDASSDAVSIQAQSLFIPNNLNIDNNTVYIDSTQDMVGFGVQPFLANNTQARVTIVATNNSAGLSVSNGSSVGDILQLNNNTTNVLRVARYGYTTFKNSQDSPGATAFQIQNAAGTTILGVDTTKKGVSINNAPLTYTQTNAGAPFAPKADTGAGPASYAVATADFNGDGFPDVVVANASGVSSWTLSLNTGSGTYPSSPTRTYTLGSSVASRGIATADFNRDGNADVVVSCFTGCPGGGTGLIYMGDGHGNFAAPVNVNIGASPWGITTGDFNGDGWPDIASANWTATNVAVSFNNGNGTFPTTPLAKTTATGGNGTALTVAAGDFNSDGKQDIVVSLNAANSIGVFKAIAGNDFAAMARYTTNASGTPGCGQNIHDVVVSDFNNDNHPDIAVAAGGCGNVDVYLNNGDGTFPTGFQPGYPAGTNAYGIAAGDFNDDGYNDIVVSSKNGTSSVLSFLSNNHNGTFAAKIDMQAGTDAQDLVVANVDNDKFPDNNPKLDVIGANNTGSKFSTYINQSGYTIRNAGLSVMPSTFSDSGLYIQAAAAGQSGDLLHIVDSSTNPLVVVTGGGSLGINNAAPGVNKLAVNSPVTADSAAQVLIATGAAVNKGLVVQGVDSQTANLFEAQTISGIVPSTVASIGGNGAALFKNSTDSATGFQVQSSNAANMLQVDTLGATIAGVLVNSVNIGSATTNTTLTALVLDSFSGTEPPNGTAGLKNGTMYYNTTLNKFRCYENNIWANCVGGGGSGGGNLSNGGNSAGGLVSVGSNDGYGLGLLTGTGTNNSNVRLLIDNTGSNITLNQATTIAGTAQTGAGFAISLQGGAGTTGGGALNLSGGAASAGAGGNVTIQGGAGTGGVGGNVTIDGGTGTTAGTVNIGTNSSTVYLRSVSGGTINIGSNGVANTINLGNNTTANVSQTISIGATTGTGTASTALTLGSLKASSLTLLQGGVGASGGGVTIQAGTAGVITIGNASANNPIVIGPATTGTIQIGNSATAGDITIGGATNGNNILIGNAATASGTSTVKILSGVGTGGTGTLQLGNNAYVNSIDIGAVAGAAARTINLGTGANTVGVDTINIGTGASTVANGKTINIGNTLTGAGNNLLSIGSTKNTSSTTIQGGTGTSIVLQTASTGRINLGSTTLANTVVVGNGSTSDSVASLFVLDSYSAGNSNDPATGGVVGAMYYNSFTGKFRCYQGVGGWTNCIGGSGAGSGDVNNNGNTYGTTMNLGTLDGNDLNFITNGIGNKRLTITSGGFVGINNATPAGLFRVNTPTTPDANATVLFATGADNKKGLVIQANSGTQSSNLTEWQASTSNTVLASVSATGVGSFANLLQAGHQVCDTTNIVSAGACATSLQTAYNNSTDPEIVLNNGSTTGITIRDSAGGVTGNLLEVKNNGNTVTYFKVDTSGVTTSAINVSGTATFSSGIGITGTATVSNGISLTGGNLNIATGTLQIAGTDVIDSTKTITSAVTYHGGTIGVAYGGTGVTTLAQYGILFGNAGGGIQATAPGTTGQCLTATTGAAPTWGTCTPGAASGVNDGGNNFGHTTTIGSSSSSWGLGLLAGGSQVARFSNTGQAVFQNITDSTTAFQVQKATSGTSLFTIDSTGDGKLYVGSPTPDGVATLLVLDTYNTDSNDPAGVNGAMYYNSTLGKFRCYEAGSWKDCIYSVQTAKNSSDQNITSTSYVDVSGLSFPVVAGNTYKLQCTLLVSVPAGTNGGNLSTNGPASPAQYTATFAKSLDASSGDNYATSTSYDDTNPKVNTISTGANRFIVSYSAILVNGGNSGTWTLRGKAVDGSSSITFYKNSSCNLQPL